MKKVQQGFTLIELMIVIAIIGILAAIAIPAYQDYIARSQMSEAFTLGSGLKTSVGEICNTDGTCTGADSNTSGLPIATTVKGKYVSQVDIEDGTISATMGGQSTSKILGQTVYLTPETNDGSLEWRCSSTAENKYLPASCRSS